MDLKVKYTKSSRVKIMFGIIGLLIILLIALFVFKWHGHKAINDSTQKASYNNYIYKIRYDLGAESYIYLLPDNVIKTVNVQEIYDIESNCNCMKPTGKFKYEENTINFSKETKANVIKVFDELYKKSGTKEFNADNIGPTNGSVAILNTRALKGSLFSGRRSISAPVRGCTPLTAPLSSGEGR